MYSLRSFAFLSVWFRYTAGFVVFSAALSFKAAYTFSGLDRDNGQVGKAAEMSRTGSCLSGGTLYGR